MAAGIGTSPNCSGTAASHSLNCVMTEKALSIPHRSNFILLPVTNAPGGFLGSRRGSSIDQYLTLVTICVAYRWSDFQIELKHAAGAAQFSSFDFR